MSASDDKLRRLELLLRVGVALSAETDTNRLLETILLEAKELTRADGGTLYLRQDEDSLHFAIMLAMVGAFVFAARRVPALGRWPWVSGPAYGLVLWTVMNKIVLPLRWPGPPAPFKWEAFLNQIFAHTVLVGLPIALITAMMLRRAAR